MPNPQYSQEINNLLICLEKVANSSEPSSWSETSKLLEDVSRRLDVYNSVLLDPQEPDPSLLSNVSRDLTGLSTAIQDLEDWLSKMTKRNKSFGKKLSSIKKTREKFDLATTLKRIFDYINYLNRLKAKVSISQRQITFQQGNRASVVTIINDLASDLRRIAKY